MARSLKKTNLSLISSGMDVNGNKVIKLTYSTGRAFSIQTNQTGLQNTNRLLRGLKTEKDMFKLSLDDLNAIEKEVVAYIKMHGSEMQKRKLKTY